MKKTKASLRKGAIGLVFMGFFLAPISSFSAPRIESIQYEFIPGNSGAPTRQLVKKRLVKFDNYLKSPSSEVFYVNWDAEQALPAGATVVFEYRLGNAEVNKVLRFTYPQAVSGKKRTTFNIPSSDYVSGGQVTAWRARLILDRQILSTRMSPEWEAR